MDGVILERLEREQQRDRLADAYLLTAPSRGRLRALAEEVAGRLLGVAGGVLDHPDCFVLDPEALGVAALRVEHIAARKEGVVSLEAGLRFRPSKGARRVVILHDADAMGSDAQAALLKTAEEPPPGTLLLLTALDLAPLLPALRSRCRICRAPAPPPEELARRAAAAGLAPDQWEALRQACGSGEAALDLAATERERLLGAAPAFSAWLNGSGPLDAWLAAPEGASLAEQRAAGGHFLAACLGWLAAAYPAAGPAQALRLDAVAGRLQAALADLRGQVSPSVLFEDLAVNLLRLP